ncbi:MAG: phosphatase PAP2 family protein [Candidatus Binatia bacterium]
MQVLSIDYLVMVTMTLVLIIGVYQFYFWCQRQLIRPRKELLTVFDSWFDYQPSWVWIYSGLYYPVIVLTTITIIDIRHFAYTAFSYFILLALQMAFFLLFPVESPAEWRNLVSDNNLSERLLRFVQKYDADSNCFPSMHVSVATHTSLHIMTNIPFFTFWIMLFPIFVALSALYTKRHYFLDIIPGALLGWGVFQIHKLLYF